MVHCNAILWQLPESWKKCKGNSGEDNLAQYKYGVRLEKSLNSIYSCLIEGHYALKSFEANLGYFLMVVFADEK